MEKLKKYLIGKTIKDIEFNKGAIESITINTGEVLGLYGQSDFVLVCISSEFKDEEIQKEIEDSYNNK